MRTFLWLLALAIATPLAASECIEQVRAVGEQFPASEPPDRDLRPGPGTASASSSDNAGMKGVPNTGGIAANPPGKPTLPQRNRITELLEQARLADGAGDPSGCMSNLAEARRLGQGEDVRPEPRHNAP